MNSDDFFKIYKRFDFLRGRLLLDREIELAELEEKLVALDKENASAVRQSVMTRHMEEFRDVASCQKFRDLKAEIEKKLGVYGKEIHFPKFEGISKLNFHGDDLVFRMKRFVDFQPPHAEDHESYANYILDEKPLCLKENICLERSDDYMTIADGREIGWLDVALTQFLDLFPTTVRE